MEARVYMSIEYETPQSIQICVMGFERHNCIHACLSSTHINDMHLVSV